MLIILKFLKNYPLVKINTSMTTFNRTEYNKQYYLRNKDKLDRRRLDNYHKNKETNSVIDFVKYRLDDDMMNIRNMLLEVDETDPNQVEMCIELMNLAKTLLLLKAMSIGDDETEINKIKSMQIPTLFQENV
jgi:hypothetical protein